jgi:primary-amine oxidase
MPAEPVSIMIRASNFSLKNPALWVPPTAVNVDPISKLAFSEYEENTDARSSLKL